MYRSLLMLFTVGVMTLVSSSCTSQAEVAEERSLQGESYSTAHLPLQKLGRTKSCCTAQGKTFAVAAAGRHAAKAADEMNKKGCNLIDAAVASTFVLAVERPQSTGIGGGGFMTVRLRNSNENQFLDFRETAPHSAHSKMFLKDDKKVENLSRDGVHAAGTPGFVAGLYEAYEKYGSHKAQCRWNHLLEPAIRLAEEGFTVYPSLAERIEIRKGVLALDENAAKLLLPSGTALKVGDKLIQKDLGHTLRTIAATGKRDFYSGTIARAIAEFIKTKALPGIPHVDATDLKNYRTRFTAPLVGNFHGYQIITAPPPSAGGVILLESLNVLSGFDLAAERSKAHYVHLLSETLLRAFADRGIIGDDGKTTYRKLLTAEYAEAARKRLDLQKATPAANVKPGELLEPETPHTAQVSLMDDKGNAVSVTTTVNFYFGSGNMVPGTGIFLNDEMDDFATAPGKTNISGLPSALPNEIAPGKRPISSMVPTVITKDGEPVLVIGAAGSSSIVSGMLQAILSDLVLAPYDVKRALFEGRMHKQWDPANDVLSLEPAAFDADTEAALRKMGHQLAPAKFMPQIQAVGRDPQNRLMTAVHEPRDEGGVVAE